MPSERQLRWHEMEFYGFLHFTVNTFTDKEWGYGDESETVFHPTAFDAEQIVRTAKEAGMKGLILTAKHHDGFCLWPSKFTKHSVKNSPWKNGQGDVVKEISDACRQQGIKFGVYLSPWDRNHQDYARPDYITYYRNQLRELLTNYGDIFTVWFDGANGGDGFYGGARETRRIDNRVYYDWPNTWKLVRTLMPMAVMFSDAGPDFRWVGNEAGVAGDPCWATLDMTKPGRIPGGSSAGLNSGERPGTAWLPAECDVSIRPGWFYHASEDHRVKTPSKLLDIYYKSVGRGACLNLNLPPDRRGQIHENDRKALREFRRLLDDTFATNLAKDAKFTASNVRGGGAKPFAPENVLDGNRDSYWATDDAVTNAELVLDLGQPATFNVVDLRECLTLGQRVDAFALDQWKDGGWKQFAQGTSIGSRRLLRTSYITTAKVRLRITQAAACPAMAELGLYAEPVIPGPPKISRDKQGQVSLSLENPGPHLHYTLDGSEPTPRSARFEVPFPLPKGGTVRARAFSPPTGTGQEQPAGDAVSETFGVAKTKWKVVSASYQSPGGGEASRAIDDKPETLWHTHGPQGERKPPQEIVVDLGETLELTALLYQPRRDGTARGLVDRYEFAVSEDGQHWTPAAAGEFANIKSNPLLQTVPLRQPMPARFFRFTALRAVEANHVAVAELGVTAR
ncbi:MAG: alpha-L-fucosidase [Verrucomicrobia bacterium]|nr:alpha-L-fucosidase [Verrucomicrobiota bacterium]